MAALPYMRFYPADYLADTAHLSPMQHGIYLLLLFNYWQRGGPLPNDDMRLAKIARVSMRDWRRNRDEIEQFFTSEENHWRHGKVERELAHVRAKSLKSQEAAQASVQRRFGGRSTDVEPTDTDTDTRGSSEPLVRAPRSKSRKAARPLPSDWKPLEPGPTGAAAMIERNWSRERREQEIEGFIAHHGSRANVMVDWQKAWQNWVLNSFKFDRGQANGKGQSTGDRTLAGAEAAFGPYSTWSNDEAF